MEERRRKDIERWATLLGRLEVLEGEVGRLSKLPNGKSDEEIIGILYKEVGKGTISFLVKLFLYAGGVLGTIFLAWLGIKGYSKSS